MLILCGYSGCGKTTLAQAYAHRFGGVVVDTDAQLEIQFGKQVRELHMKWGETRFREQEGFVLACLSRNIDVLATGGGTLCREENGAFLRELGTLVFLYVAPEILWTRLCQRALPPTFVAEGYEAFQQHYEQRNVLYRRWCDRVLSVTSVEETLETLRKEMRHG
jgi:shikimate kinase